MSTSVTRPHRYYLGLDGGGSKCRALVVDLDGRHLGTAVTGPANPALGVVKATQTLEAVARAALDNAGCGREPLSTLAVGAGLAGMNLPGVQRQMADWAHPFAALQLTTDLHIACLGAHRRDAGAVIVVGTGSCGYVRHADEERMLGGYGFTCGDQGSGAWLGVEAVKAVLLAADRLGPATALTEALVQGDSSLALALAERMHGKLSSEFARLAPMVIQAAEAGDPVAVGIVSQGAGYLSALALQLLEYGRPRLSLIGGLAKSMEPWLDPDVRDQLVPPLDPPEVGAVRLVQQQA